MGALVLAANEEFSPPTANSFDLPPIFGPVTKPMLLAVLSVIIIAAYFLLSSKKMSVVPSKGQFLAESLYDFGRNNIAREQIGAGDFVRFVPLVLTLFTFVLVNNLFGLIPFLQFPTTSHIGFPLALSVLVVYPVYHGAGIRRHGVGRYLKNQLFPPGAPTWVYILLAPIEFFTKFVVNPLTLAVRVFAAMFAGHMLITLFSIAGEFLLVDAGGALAAVGGLSYITAILITFLEALIMAIQAYIFALLSASYIGTALAEQP